LSTDTPFLLSLDDLDRLKCEFRNLTDELVTPKTTVKVHRQFGHAFLLWGPGLLQFISSSIATGNSYLTDAELRRLHRRFGHPLVEKLSTLLESSGHEADSEVIKRLTKYCEYCQKYGQSPRRYKFTIRDPTLAFNHAVYANIMWINGKQVVYLIDEATRF
jgi:hypothetical protein